MEAIIAIVVCFSLAGIVAFFWVRGIDYMSKNHPDYKGEDFLNWGKEDAPWETDKKWDDNKAHTEGSI